MNDGGYRVPGRDVDGTAIEQEKIRQTAETKRKLIEEKEKTKREQAQRSKEKWTEGGFQFMFGASVVSVAAAAAIIGGVYFHGKYPGPPDLEPACAETSEIVSSTTSARRCSPGATLVTEKLANSDALVKCLCPGHAVVGDAGHP